jgi:hypothetical protein
LEEGKKQEIRVAKVEEEEDSAEVFIRHFRRFYIFEHN